MQQRLTMVLWVPIMELFYILAGWQYGDLGYLATRGLLTVGEDPSVNHRRIIVHNVFEAGKAASVSTRHGNSGIPGV